MGRLARSLAVVAAVVALAAPSLSGTPSIEGRWVLVEQSYGRGDSNLARRAPDLHLDVIGGLDTTRVLVWSGADDGDALPWPAVVTREAPATLEILEKNVESGRLHSRYLLRPPTEDGLTLEMVETYTLDPDGGALAGELSVRMFRQGEPRGSFVLHRRFERVSR
jgi:hypothetical protein